MSNHTNNRISREEFDDSFNKLDFDGNGKVTIKELEEQGFNKQ